MLYKKILTCMLLLLCFTVFSCAQQEETIAEKTVVDFSLQDLSGNTVSLSDYRGQVVVLDFWATWCPPCRASIPELEKLYKKYKDDKVVFLGLNAGEDKTEVSKFVEKNNMQYKVLLCDNKTASKFAIRALPTIIIIDKDGAVFNRYIGFSAGSNILWEKDIEQNLK